MHLMLNFWIYCGPSPRRTTVSRDELLTFLSPLLSPILTHLLHLSSTNNSLFSLHLSFLPDFQLVLPYGTDPLALDSPRHHALALIGLTCSFCFLKDLEVRAWLRFSRLSFCIFFSTTQPCLIYESANAFSWTSMTRIKRDEEEEGVRGWGGERSLWYRVTGIVSKEDGCFSSMIMRNKDALLKLPGFPIRHNQSCGRSFFHAGFT